MSKDVFKSQSLNALEQSMYQTLVSTVVELQALQDVLIRKGVVSADELLDSAKHSDTIERVNSAAYEADLIANPTMATC